MIKHFYDWQLFVIRPSEIQVKMNGNIMKALLLLSFVPLMISYSGLQFSYNYCLKVRNNLNEKNLDRFFSYAKAKSIFLYSHNNIK